MPEDLYLNYLYSPYNMPLLRAKVVLNDYREHNIKPSHKNLIDILESLILYIEGNQKNE